LIRKQLDGHVGMKVRKWHSTNEPWTGLDDQSTNWVYLMANYPHGQPPTFPPQNLDLQATLKSISHIISFDALACEKWKLFFDNTCTLSTRQYQVPDDVFDMAKVCF